MQQIENVTFLKKEVKSTMSELIKAIDAESMKTDLPVFNVGDTVKVGYKIMPERTAVFRKLSPYATFLTA